MRHFNVVEEQGRQKAALESSLAALNAECVVLM